MLKRWIWPVVAAAVGLVAAGAVVVMILQAFQVISWG
jgi:hypothetical protein